MASRVKPTTLVPRVRITSMCKRSLRRRNTRAKIIWSASWPQPQRAPTTAFSIFVQRLDKGAKAARWSGPDSVCKQPARKPVHALVSNSVLMSPPVLVTTCMVECAGGARMGWITATKDADSRTAKSAEATWDILSCNRYHNNKGTTYAVIIENRYIPIINTYGRMLALAEQPWKWIHGCHRIRLYIDTYYHEHCTKQLYIPIIQHRESVNFKDVKCQFSIKFLGP